MNWLKKMFKPKERRITQCPIHVMVSHCDDECIKFLEENYGKLESEVKEL